MLNIVLFGPPGAGKGTQAEKLTDKFGLVHLSTGDIFRKHKEFGTELGLLAKNYMDQGQLVPDEVTIRMLEAELDRHPMAAGFIFDGFPRTTAQAESLDTFLHKRGSAITMTLALEVNEDELIKRIILRGQSSGRADDQDEKIVRRRVEEYNNKTAPLKQYYAGQGKLHVIQGVGEIGQIFDALCHAIERVVAEREISADLHKMFPVKKATLPDPVPGKKSAKKSPAKKKKPAGKNKSVKKKVKSGSKPKSKSKSKTRIKRKPSATRRKSKPVKKSKAKSRSKARGGKSATRKSARRKSRR